VWYMARKKKKKGSIVPFALCLGALIITVAALPFMDGLFMNKYEVKEKKEEEKKKIPDSYSCSYGPTYDEVYDYTKEESIEFTFDKEGKVTNVSSVASYRASTTNSYEVLKSDLSINNNDITLDEKNYMIIVRTNTNKIENTSYPQSYEKLKDYISQNGYTCSEN